MKLLKCEDCPSVFGYRKNLLAHERKFHNKYSTVPKLLKCDKCAVGFSHRGSLYLHKRKFHNEISIVPKVKTLKCDECAAKFSYKRTLYAHEKKFHNKIRVTKTKCNQEIIKRKSTRDKDCSKAYNSRLLCPQEPCIKRFRNNESLREHLFTEHKIVVQTEGHEFTSLESFQRWKENIQQKEISFYIRDSAPHKCPDGSLIAFYNCHRSYAYVPKGKNKRSLKSKGSLKTGKACPSRMKVTMIGDLNQPSSVKVQYWKTHLGHELQIEHIPLDGETKAQLAGQLKEGASFNDILKTIKDKVRNNQDINQRLAILRKKDLHNIVRDFNIDYNWKQLKEVPKGENFEECNDITDSDQGTEQDIIPEILTKEECDDITDSDILMQNIVPDVPTKDSLINKFHLIIGLLNEMDEISLDDYHKIEKEADGIINLLNGADLEQTENIKVVTEPLIFEVVDIGGGLMSSSTGMLDMQDGYKYSYYKNN